MPFVDELKARFSRGLNVHTVTALIAFVLMPLEFKIIGTEGLSTFVWLGAGFKSNSNDESGRKWMQYMQCMAAEKAVAMLAATSLLWLTVGAHLRISWAHLPFMLLGVPCVIYEHFYDFYTNYVPKNDFYGAYVHKGKESVCHPPAPAFHALCGFLGLVGIAFAIWSWNLTRLQKKDQKANPMVHLQAELGKESGHLCNCMNVHKFTVGVAVVRVLLDVANVALVVPMRTPHWIINKLFLGRVVNAAYTFAIVSNNVAAALVCPLVSIVCAVLLVVGVWKRNRWFHPADVMFSVPTQFETYAWGAERKNASLLSFAPSFALLSITLVCFWFAFFAILRSHLHFRSEAKCHELRRLLEHRLSLQSPPNPRPRLSQAEPLDVPPPPQLPL
ncbi:hypothetical protein M3Y99_01671300 [Aphelenchoides fujianensis]|nr:hypothetical protein M3Y99_01671300 [Aphelenchoides fujianensis]